MPSSSLSAASKRRDQLVRHFKFSYISIHSTPYKSVLNASFFSRCIAEQRHLQHLYQRCTNADELEKALKLTRLNYLARGELMQHNPFSHKTSQVLLHEALRLQAPELAQKALQHPADYGLSESSSTKYFNKLLVYYSKAGNILQLLELYEQMKREGPVPDSETCFVMVRGLVDAGRNDLAELVIREFDGAGVRVRNGTRLYLEQHRSSHPLGGYGGLGFSSGGNAQMSPSSQQRTF